MMGISRSGYYKWKKRGKSDRDIQRRELIALVDTVHAEHRSHGYRWTAAYIRQQYGYECSDNFVYKCFRYLGIKAETKHQLHYRKRKIKDVRLHTVVCFMSDFSCSEQRCSYSAASSLCRLWIPFSFFKLTALGRVSSGSRMKD